MPSFCRWGVFGVDGSHVISFLWQDPFVSPCVAVISLCPAAYCLYEGRYGPLAVLCMCGQAPQEQSLCVACVTVCRREQDRSSAEASLSVVLIRMHAKLWQNNITNRLCRELELVHLRCQMSCVTVDSAAFNACFRACIMCC